MNAAQGYDSQGFQGQDTMAQSSPRRGVLPKARNVISFPFAGNHLVEISLMYQQQNDGRKRHYFCFFKLLPAGKNGATYRSADHITMKLSLDRALEVGKALRAIATGAGDRLGSFITFTDTSKAGTTSEKTNAGKKSLSCFMVEGQKGPKVMLSIALGKDKYSFPMTPYYAGSMADIIEKVALQGVDLEFERQRAINRRSF